MSLHDQITGDDLNVFLDPEDFAEIHNVNGTECMAILQKISAEDLSGTHYEVYRDLMMVNCKVEDLPEIPRYGQTFRVDGKLYIVDSCSEDMGMLTIKLEANDR